MSTIIPYTVMLSEPARAGSFYAQAHFLSEKKPRGEEGYDAIYTALLNAGIMPCGSVEGSYGSSEPYSSSSGSSCNAQTIR